MLLFQCFQLTQNKIYKEYNTTILPRLAYYKSESDMKKYIEKLTFLNLGKCLKTFKTSEFTDAISSKNYNKSTEILYKSLDSNLAQGSSLDLTSYEEKLKRNLLELRKEVESYKSNGTTSNYTNLSDKISSFKKSDSNIILIGVIGVGLIVVIILIKCFCCSTKEDSDEVEEMKEYINTQSKKVEKAKEEIKINKDEKVKKD